MTDGRHRIGRHRAQADRALIIGAPIAVILAGGIALMAVLPRPLGEASAPSRARPAVALPAPLTPRISYGPPRSSSAAPVSSVAANPLTSEPPASTTDEPVGVAPPMTPMGAQPTQISPATSEGTSDAPNIDATPQSTAPVGQQETSPAAAPTRRDQAGGPTGVVFLPSGTRTGASRDPAPGATGEHSGGCRIHDPDRDEVPPLGNDSSDPGTRHGPSGVVMGGRPPRGDQGRGKSPARVHSTKSVPEIKPTPIKGAPCLTT